MKTLPDSKQRGAVSLFIVIFTALLVTIISVSFTQLMIRNQQQVTANDLSQRAYNSAMAGVEDAKRILISAAKACNGSDPVRCSDIEAAITADTCDTLRRAGLVDQRIDEADNKEVTVGTDDDNQAYTCVKILRDTPDYRGSLTTTNTSVVPLRGVKPFDRVRITWFTKGDIQATGATEPTFPAAAPTLKLPPMSAENWPASAPPLLRAQYIPGNTALSDLTKEARSAFLYPENGGNSMGGSFDLQADPRRAGHGTIPQQANCVSTFESPGGSVNGICQFTLELPDATRSAYLQLAALYNATSFTLELCDGGCTAGGIVKFDNVQPIVDSTGRADSLFRRVKARVTVKEGISLPYPEAAISVQNDLCKTFFITDKATDYKPGTCDPSKQTLTP